MASRSTLGHLSPESSVAQWGICWYSGPSPCRTIVYWAWRGASKQTTGTFREILYADQCGADQVPHIQRKLLAQAHMSGLGFGLFVSVFDQFFFCFFLVLGFPKKVRTFSNILSVCFKYKQISHHNTFQNLNIYFKCYCFSNWIF
jgi:hypothetical protein